MKQSKQEARSPEQGAISRLYTFCSVLLFVFMLGGCGGRANGPPPPPTYSVRGEVHLAGGQPVAKGLVQFFPETGPPRNISAPIKDGKFTLVTSFGNQTVSGTVEGRYRVKVIPGFDPHGAPVEVNLPDIYEIKPQDNHFILTLPKG